MYKGHRIIIFLVVFCCFALAPMILNIGNASEAPTPALDTPAINALAKPACIESTEYMRAEHMQLLDDWRHQTVRSGNLEYLTSSGQAIEMSLQNTCLSCHTNRVEFCTPCHDYVAVDPACWHCHLDEEGLAE